MSVHTGIRVEDSEHTLLSRVARGEEIAVQKLYRDHGDAIIRFICRRVEDRLEDAEEITLDTFVSAIDLAHNFDARCSVRTWLCGIAKARIIDFYRRVHRAKRIPSSSICLLDESFSSTAEFEQVIDQIDAVSAVDAMLARLTDEEKEAILLRYGDQLSTRETAAMMGRTERAVESLLIRGKNKAKAKLGAWMQG